MANTYTQIHIHFVIAVKYRDGVIDTKWKNDLYKYITGIVQKNKHKMICINGVMDHLHFLIGLRPSQSISDLLQDVKAYSSKWINDNKFVKGHFEWQEGYGVFSYSKSQISKVCNYIENQEVHHTKKSFKEEYLDMLKKFEIAFDEKYVFAELI